MDATDLNSLALSWQWNDATSWAQGDFNGDGNVNASDLNSLALNWRTGTAQAAAVPEPSSVLLLILGGVVIMSSRRQSKKHCQHTSSQIMPGQRGGHSDH